MMYLNKITHTILLNIASQHKKKHNKTKLNKYYTKKEKITIK